MCVAKRGTRCRFDRRKPGVPFGDPQTKRLLFPKIWEPKFTQTYGLKLTNLTHIFCPICTSSELENLNEYESCTPKKYALQFLKDCYERLTDLWLEQVDRRLPLISSVQQTIYKHNSSFTTGSFIRVFTKTYEYNQTKVAT